MKQLKSVEGYFIKAFQVSHRNKGVIQACANSLRCNIIVEVLERQKKGPWITLNWHYTR